MPDVIADRTTAPTEPWWEVMGEAGRHHHRIKVITAANYYYRLIASPVSTGIAHLPYDWPCTGLKDTTTDCLFNKVDCNYIVGAGVWVTERERPALPSIAQLLAELRDKVDLPIEDLAAMVGLGRRHFYNLLGGDSASPSREQQIRVMHELISRLGEAVEGDRTRLRAAILMPVGDQLETLFSVAKEGDTSGIRSLGKELLRRMETGDVSGLLPRPAPHLQRLVRPGAEDRVHEFVHDHADRPTHEVDGAER